MSTFACWDVFNSEQAEAKNVEALTAQDAAVKHAEWIWSQSDYPNEMEIAVQVAAPFGRALLVFKVEARQEVNFYAHLKGKDE